MYTYWPQDILIPVDFLNQRVDHYLQELGDFATGMEWAETIFLFNMNDCLITISEKLWIIIMIFSYMIFPSSRIYMNDEWLSDCI